MSERLENLGERENLRQQRKRLFAQISSHRDAIRAALPMTADPEMIDRDYLLSLAMLIGDALGELNGLDRKIAILNRELE